MSPSSANYIKALTGTAGDPNYTLQTPVMTPRPPDAPLPHAGCSETQLLHLQTTLYKQLVVPWVSGFLCTVQYDR